MAGLGRRVQFDERSRSYPIRGLVPPTLKGRSWPCKPTLDQGNEGACVGFGWSHELAAQPVVISVSNDSARGLYKQAQTLDEWPGENYEGTSVLAGAKAVVQRGLIGEFRWAFAFDDVLQALSHHGPVVLGTNWKDSMFDVPPNGILDCSGSVVGGHCFLARGLLLKPSFAKEPLVRCRNSWGAGWGIGGDFFLRLPDLQLLLADEGEACVPVHRRHAQA